MLNFNNFAHIQKVKKMIKDWSKKEVVIDENTESANLDPSKFEISSDIELFYADKFSQQ